VDFFVSENGETSVEVSERSSITRGTGEDVEKVHEIANEDTAKFRFVSAGRGGLGEGLPYGIYLGIE
jgi:hypothetical protein